MLHNKKHNLKLVVSRIINIHGSLEGSNNDIFETQDLVIATNSMPKKDWVKTRVFSWMASLLYFDKLLQIPFIIIHKSIPVHSKYPPFLLRLVADVGFDIFM